MDMLKAARMGDLGAIRAAIKNSENLNARDARGMTALMRASPQWLNC